MDIYNKEKYEKLIKNSSLFVLDKEKEYIAYKREAIKMVEYLYCYLLAINEKKYIDYGLEISKTANYCINNYKSDVGGFLNYFNKAWANEYRRASGRRIAEEYRCGIHISDDEQRLISRFLKFARKRNANYKYEEVIEIGAKALGVDKDRIIEIIKIINGTQVISDIFVDEDGEEKSLFELIPIEQDCDLDDSFHCTCKRIENIFNTLQERQKKLISKIITLKVIEKATLEDRQLEELRQYSFFDIGIYQGVISKQEINIRHIAQQCGVSEQSASRSYKNFLEKLK